MLINRVRTVSKSFSGASVLYARCSTQYRIPSIEDEYTAEPKYPPILDLSARCERQREIESWYKKIERQVTIEEKLFELNMPRYYGWKCIMLHEAQLPFNSLQFIQYITRTHVLKNDLVPAMYDHVKSATLEVLPAVKIALEEELSFQMSVKRKSTFDEKENARNVINCIHRVLMRELCPPEYSVDAQVDYNSRLEAFWSIGGIEPPESVKKRRKDEEGLKDEAEINEQISRWVQYLGSPVLQVRHKHPLPTAWDTNIVGEVPVVTLDPEVLGFGNDYRHGTSIPGFWPGDKGEFSVLSYHLTNDLNHRPPSYGADEFREALVSQGILSSFGWLVSLYAYQGFTPFSEITYPFVTQTVLTDGTRFAFMTYQMNTNLLHSEFATENPKVNLCCCSDYEQLYTGVEGDKLVGLNENVLRRLVEMYLVRPVEREGVNLKPYLGKNIQRIAEIEHEEKRIWLENQFKHFSANRPRNRVDLQYEIYEWERIYKIEHKTRPMDALRRPFELNQHPYRRKMSDHLQEYIPRCIRPDKDLPKYKQKKYRDTYYPQ